MSYIETLEKVCRSELINTLFYSIILITITIAIWIINYFYFKKKFKENNKKGYLKGLKSAYKNSIKACIVVTLIFIAIAIVFVLLGYNSIDQINKDIEQNSFEIYNGNYYVDYDFNAKSYPKYLDVYLENGEVISVYNKNFIEYLLTENGAHTGKVVYGKNSLIVVDMDN